MTIKSNHFNMGLLLTALTLLPVAPAATAGDQVPYKAAETGVITHVSFQFPFETKSAVAAGEATHLGDYTLIGEFVVDVRFGTATGTYTMMAANGDMLFLTMNAHSDPSDLTKTVSNFTVTGGTGRF